MPYRIKQWQEEEPLAGDEINIDSHLMTFRGEGPGEEQNTDREVVLYNGSTIPRYVNEFWTSRQRAGSPLHEVPYRACFKPQLPAFFIKLLTSPGDCVYDPFSGRGTTVIEAGLLDRSVISNDANPLTTILTRPRFFVPARKAIKDRLSGIPKKSSEQLEKDLSMFYHPDTISEIAGLREYLLGRQESGEEDEVDSWIRMVATTRLTGHSKGFFSVYTLPPNQAISCERQLVINARRCQTPEYRDTHRLILRKSESLLRGLDSTARNCLLRAGEAGLFLNTDARATPGIASGTVALTVTSPPFLDVVQYSNDNWLRCWFNGFDAGNIARHLTMAKSVTEWSGVMESVFRELFRVTKEKGWIAFEVGEVRKGTIALDEIVIPAGVNAGFSCRCVLMNRQTFSKTSHIWGIGNNLLGTNSNRVVLFMKE